VSNKRLLVIGEKPSQVKKFRDALLKKKNSRSIKESKYIYRYEGTWISTQTYEVIILPLIGHIAKIDTPEAYGWGKVPPIEIVKQPQALIVKEDPLFKRILTKVSRNVDELYIATDPDSEGDNIGFEALNIVTKANPILKTNVKRVWNSSLTHNEITRAFKQAESRPPGWDTRLALSVEGRQICDAFLGFAGTREITQAARQVHPIRVFSVGRVQLPTLNMIVDRDIKHETFIPKDFWNIKANLISSSGEEFEGNHKSNPIKDENLANQIRNRLKGVKQGNVSKLIPKVVKRKPPAPLNTTAALSLLARLFKLKANTGLKILSDLYLEGYLSYPRTENARFKAKFPHNKILQKLSKNSTYTALISKIQSKHQVRTNGRKMGVEDHDPIHPTGELPPPGKLQKIQSQVLYTLTRHYIGLFMDDLILNKVKAEVLINQELFLSEGSTIINKGWIEAITWSKPKDKILPKLKVNEIISIKQIRKSKSQTKPKPRWSDATILKQMQRLGLGTKSSRPSILEKLVERGYITRNKTQIISQPSGRVLIKILEPIWSDIVTNAFTKHVETKMDEVATGQKPYKKMIDELRLEYIQAHQLLLKNIPMFQHALKEVDPSLLPGFRKDSKSKFKNKVTSIKKTTKSVKKAYPANINHKQDTPSLQSGKTTKCPLCNQGNQIQRQNRSSGEKFLGCIRYPDCKWTQKLKQTTKTSRKANITKHTSKKHIDTSVPQTKIPVSCPTCKKGTLVKRVNRTSGNTFFGCSFFPQCRHTQTKL
jgi:DNA topoisomerase-1